MTEDQNAINLDRIADALETLVTTLDKIEQHLAPQIINATMATPDPMTRIADALDSLAALHAAGPALTGLQPGTSPEAVPAQPDADGWIPHRGGNCPVPDDTVVAIRLRTESGWRENNGYRARDWVWRHGPNKGNGDVIAYKVIE
jgi:hypothetical protein